MYNFLTILFCLLDVGFWKKSNVVSWADELISKLDQPKTWIINLSISTNVGSAIEIVRSAMRANNVVLPDNVGDLLVGLVLLRFDNAELSAKEAKDTIFDIVDAYGASDIDVEAVLGRDLSDNLYTFYRDTASVALSYVKEEKYLHAEVNLFEE